MHRGQLDKICLVVSALFMTITLVLWLEYTNRIHQHILSHIRVSEHLNDNTYNNHNALTNDTTTNYSNNATVTRAFDTDIYLFSAFKVRYEDFQYPFDKSKYRVNNNTPTDVILINGWQRGSVKSRHFKCCVLLKNNTVVEIKSNRENMQYPASLRAIQYVCPSAVQTYLIKLVSIVLGDKKCSDNDIYYIHLNRGSLIRNSKLAVCAKLTYESVDAAQLVEWFEAQRVLGVDKVVTYTFNLNANALKVLQYYESTGFLDVIHGFYLPELDKIKRYQGQQVVQSWNDQQVVVYDCTCRLWTYRYVGVFDKDEFIVPKLKSPIQGALRSYMDRISLDKTIAGITVDTKLHFTTHWAPTVENAHLNIERFLNSTRAKKDRIKNIHMPQRVIPGSVRTHDYDPFKGFKRYQVPPGDGANHHYRPCRSEWHKLSVKKKQNQFGNRTQCDEFGRYYSTNMLLVVQAIEKNVLQIINDLQLPTK